MAPKKICVGIQNFKFACSKICGYLKLWVRVLKIKILWVLKFFGYSKIVGTQICGYIKFVMIQNSR